MAGNMCDGEPHLYDELSAHETHHECPRALARDARQRIDLRINEGDITTREARRLTTIQKMVGVLRDELDLCYRFLAEHKLLSELRDTKRNKVTKSSGST